MGASHGKQKKSKHHKLDIGKFTPLPHNLLLSQEFRNLSYAERCLLFDIAIQLNGHNNGKLVCCASYLKPLRWNSNDTIYRALKSLVNSGILVQTRQGMMPPLAQAGWFALSWLPLHVREGLDISPSSYRRTIFTPIDLLKPIRVAK